MQPIAPSGLDGFQHRSRPVHPPLHLFEYARIDPLIALDAVAHAPWRVEIDCLKRPHEGPAQSQPVANTDVDILDAGIAVGHEAEYLLKQGACSLFMMKPSSSRFITSGA